MTLKYLGIVLKIVRNSYLEALSCQQQDSGNNGDLNPDDVASDIIDSASMSGSILQKNQGFGNQAIKKNTIKEEDEDLDSDEDMEGRFGDDQKLAAVSINVLGLNKHVLISEQASFARVP